MAPSPAFPPARRTCSRAAHRSSGLSVRPSHAQSGRTEKSSPPAAGVSAPERFVNQREAARLAGCSKDSIIRARRAGRFEGARQHGNQWEIPVDDLAAAGLLLPPDERPDPTETGLQDLAEARIELVRVTEKLGALEVLVAHQDEELRFLRKLAADALAGRGSSQ